MVTYSVPNLTPKVILNLFVGHEVFRADSLFFFNLIFRNKIQIFPVPKSDHYNVI